MRSNTVYNYFVYLQKLLYIRKHIYTASKVKHRLIIFLHKIVTLYKHEFIFVTFMKIDNKLNEVTIYSTFLFDMNKVNDQKWQMQTYP